MFFLIVHITPIHKKGSLRNILKYGPVSVLNDLCKIFEKVLYNCLQSLCQASNFLAKNQFGFEKHRNTGLVVLSLLDKVLLALEDKNYTTCVSHDYSACFDTLSRPILHDNLERLSISGVSVDIMNTYYKNRSQCVCDDAVNS